MAAISDHFGTVALNSTTEVVVVLDETFAYQVKHIGKDAAGNDDANSQITAFLSYASGVTADLSEEDDKYPLLHEQSVEIGPGIGTLYIDSTTGADGILAFARKGEMTRDW